MSNVDLEPMSMIMNEHDKDERERKRVVELRTDRIEKESWMSVSGLALAHRISLERAPRRP